MDEIISYKRISLLAFPVIMSQSVVLVNSLIDLAFIGPFGTNAIAAVAIANALCATLFNFLEGFRIGTTVLIAKAAAADDRQKGIAVINTGILLSALVGIAIAMSAPFISNIVYDLFGNEQIKTYGLDYLRIWLYTLPLILMSFVLTGLFRGLSDTKTPLYCTVLVCVLNALLGYLLVYGGLGIPSMGVKGAAIATMLANIAGLLLTAYLTFTKPHTYNFMALRLPNSDQVSEYSALAVEIGLNTGFTLLALLAFVGIIRDLGANALAVHQITLQVFNFAYLPSVGFLITASILVPQLIEHKQHHLLIPTVRRISKLSLGIISITSGMVFIAAPLISNFFSPADSTVAAESVQTLRLVCFGQLFSSVYMVMRGTLTGCKDTRFIVYEGLVSGYLVFLPLAYLFAIKLHYGVYGGYIAFLLWCLFDCLALLYRVHLSPLSAQFRKR